MARNSSLLSVISLLLLSPYASGSVLDDIARRADPTTTILSTVTVSGPTAISTPDSASYTNTQDFESGILNSTNFYRYEHNATALTWNTSLADYAQSWASHCEWKHSGGPNGENLAEGYPDVTAAVDGWGNERAKYNFNKPTGFSEATGHFTQLVWKDTTTTGCAAVNCTGKGGMDGFYVVCEYYPPGNIVGENNLFFQENVQSQIHSSGPAGSSATTTTATPSASSTGQNGLGNDGSQNQAARGLWTVAAVVGALVLAGGMI